MIQGTGKKLKLLGTGNNVIEDHSLIKFSGGVGDLPLASSTLPLDYSVSDTIKTKIWSNTHIEFYDLLYPTKASKFTMGVHQSEDGTGLCILPGKPKTLLDIADWSTAFCIFATVYAKKFPHDLCHLLKHGENVRQIARDEGNWAYYDNEFRKLRQAIMVPWGMFHTELAHRALHSEKRGAGFPRPSWANRHSFRGQPPNATFRSPPATHPKGTCFKYHTAKFRCEGPCNFPHSCYKCEGTHPVYRCPKSGNQGSTPGKSATPTSAAITWSSTTGSTRPGPATNTGKSHQTSRDTTRL